MKKTLFIFSTILFTAFNAAGTQFGSNGYEGRDGYHGNPGRSGTSASVTAEGASAMYNLSGWDGEQGFQGERGGDANSCYQPPNVAYNLQGARGGNGGNGGRGGAGGDSGSLTVYYTDIAALKKVYVRATPGRGGRGMYGERGGRACRCVQSQWQVKVGETVNTYTCRDGAEGYKGQDGSYGSNGRYGSVKLIGQLSPPAPEHPQASLYMTDMEQSPYDLSANNWENRTGGRYLFADGSDLSDQYVFFSGRDEVSYKLSWKAQRPLSDFAGKKMSLHLQNGRVSLGLPSDVWYKGEETGGVNYTFQTVLYQKDVFSMRINAVTGSKSALTVEIKDNANVSELVETTYRVLYKSRYNNGLMRKRYDGPVPKDLVTQTAGGAVIAVGRLPIEQQYMTPGTKTYVEVSAKRSLGNKQATQEMSVNQTLGN